MNWPFATILKLTDNSLSFKTNETITMMVFEYLILIVSIEERFNWIHLYIQSSL